VEWAVGGVEGEWENHRQSIGTVPSVLMVLMDRIKDEPHLVLGEEKGIAIHQRLF
jgi:hypothetical protein